MSTKTLNKDPGNKCLPADCPAGPPRVIICGVRQASFASETVGTEYKDEDYISHHAAAQRRSGTALVASWEMQSSLLGIDPASKIHINKALMITIITIKFVVVKNEVELKP